MTSWIVQMLASASSLAIDSTIATTAWLLGAVLLLDLFDISLPRGDSVGVAGALGGAAVVMVGPARATAVVLSSCLIAHLLRRSTGVPSRLLTRITSRCVALVCAILTLAIVSAQSREMIWFTFVPAVYLLSEMVASQVVVATLKARSLARLIKGNLGTQAPTLAAQWSGSVLLLITFEDMRAWSLIPVVALLLLMRQSYALYLDIRETYRATVEVLVEAAESQDERRLGHAERTAATARAIAMHIGLTAPAVERISYVALLHDLAEISSPAASEGFIPLRDGGSAGIVEGVEFFSSVQPVLRACDGNVDAIDSCSEVALAAMIVALASDIDCELNVAVRAAHREHAMERIVSAVPFPLKARAVGAAIELGYPIPAVG